MGDKIIFSDIMRLRAIYSGKDEAVYDYDNKVKYSYSDLAARANKLACFLTNTLHLKKGDRIGFCACNAMPFLDAFYASCQTGIIITTYNYMLHPKEIITQINHEQPRILFYSKQFSKIISAIKANGGPTYYIAINGPAAEGDSYCYEDIMAADACDRSEQIRIPEIDIDPEDIQMLIHTGGTTGAPKAAQISYRSLFYNQICEMLTLGISSKDCAYVCMPWFHTGGWNLFTLPLLMAGGRLIISERFIPEQCLAAIREERPTCLMAVETMFKALASSPDFDKTDFSSIRHTYNGGSPIARETLQKYWDKGVKLANAYGMTEAGPNNLVPPTGQMSMADIQKRWDCAGRPMYFNRVRIVDEDNKDVPQGEKGELIWKGILTFSGYWQDEKNTKEIMTDDGWVRSGDIGYCDADGFYYICGRRKNMFISGGENIFPVEITSVLREHPSIYDCHVFGVSDAYWGEVGKAIIVLKPDAMLTEEEIKSYLKGYIASIKIPKHYVFAEAVPRNVMGKPDAKRIAELYG